MAAKQEFESRFAKHKDELEWLFMELYHNREGLEVLEREMAEAYNARSAELKALDKARSADPEWYKRGNMFGMTMYTDLFAGNLKELAKKLPYLKEQKLTYLHLMPLLQMPHPHNDGGYAVEDFDTVDPALGTNKDLENLTRELRKAGISLCLDFVMNHTASTHRWAMAAKAGDPWFQAYYHLYEDRTIPDQYEQTVPQVFPNTAPGNFTWCEEMHKWVLTTFHDYQWDLNYANPAVFVDMTKSILHLANLGVEVFRIDAVPYIWKQLGTTCRNLPQVHTIVRMLRMVLECVCPAVILKGEVVMAPKELAAYFGTPEKPECHMLYNVSTMVNLWGALASRDTRLLKAQLDALHALPDNCWFVNYLRCHDDIGWGLDEAVENKLGIDPQKHKEYLYHFYEGNFPGSWAKGELYNYDPATGGFAALGHGINDVDTALLIPLESGSIMHAQVSDVKKGAAGQPGELHGMFRLQQDMGVLSANTPQGIFGKVDGSALTQARAPLPVAAWDQIHTGEATILSNVRGEEIEEFRIRITHLSANDDRAMTLQVTDPDLLELTGGIVQGMSGSPILQDGRIIGAVTHVMVNDPTKGYGISIARMLDAAEQSSQEKASA